MKIINENVSDNQDVKSYHNYLIKTLEHMKLASKQITSLYRDQEKSIAKQKETIVAQTSALKESKTKIEALTARIKKLSD